MRPVSQRQAHSQETGRQGLSRRTRRKPEARIERDSARRRVQEDRVFGTPVPAQGDCLLDQEPPDSQATMRLIDKEAAEVPEVLDQDDTDEPALIDSHQVNAVGRSLKPDVNVGVDVSDHLRLMLPLKRALDDKSHEVPNAFGFLCRRGTHK